MCLGSNASLESAFAMKNPLPPEKPPEEEQAGSEPEIPPGRTGEGAHSAMKHWLQEKERKRSERPASDPAH